jgi:Tol biopolymer transport system component
MSSSSQRRAALIGLVAGAACARPPEAGPPRPWTPAPIASDQYESSPTFSPDGREVVFMRSDPAFQRYRLLWSRCIDGKWSAPVSPPFAAPAPAFDADPAFSPDGAHLYFISTRQNRAPGDDDFDIWVVSRDAGGGWGTPARLPAPVNAAGSELFPRPTRDGRIYFGSDRPGGLGSGDLYVASRAGDAWRVDNLGPPVSSAAFEYEADVSADGRTLVAVIDRGDRSHLYRFERRGGTWIERGRIAARPDVFQVGPLLSPDGRRVLFAQVEPGRSGEIFLSELEPGADRSWPPSCPPR